jgi:Holliday junction resolvase RusA-like endonuclease
MTALFLPFPPTTNNLFVNSGRKRRTSEGYKKWKTDAYEALAKQLQHRRTHVGMVSLQLSLKAPNNARRDLDNTIKAVCDFLVTHGIIIADDSRIVRRITAEWKDDLPIGCYVTVHDLTVCPTRFADGIAPQLTKPRSRK